MTPDLTLLENGLVVEGNNQAGFHATVVLHGERIAAVSADPAAVAAFCSPRPNRDADRL